MDLLRGQTLRLAEAVRNLLRSIPELSRSEPSSCPAWNRESSGRPAGYAIYFHDRDAVSQKGAGSTPDASYQPLTSTDREVEE
ncbi:hypothetical protein [Thermacetogenium phaeum]|uniref:hypothetical protein n=1 Tax=Thermacetogenium phaeum TaxID=85874 RepID=UPI0011D1C21D|nr:hypothetical protein [Thermacetogenium phaeum]